jgi:transposase
MRYIFNELSGGMGHSQEKIGRGGKEAIARRAIAAQGKKPAEFALKMGVARQTVYTWKTLLDEGGIDALRSVPSRSNPARLDESLLEGLR